MKTQMTLLAALALGVGALTASSLAGCELIASVDHSLLEDGGIPGTGGQGPGGAGGIGGTGGAGGTTTSAGGGGAGGCMGPADCPDPDVDNECVEPSCTNDTCGELTLADGTPIATQAAGDCKETQCAEMGATTMVVNVDNDIFDDTKECTVDTCANGSPIHTPKLAGEACTQGNGQVCDNDGDCVECNVLADCMGTDVCQQQQCVPDTCANGVVDGEETDLNCGGTQCPPCADNLDCLVDTDCMSLVCENLVCQVPSCTDDMTNGTETDLNCGGMCPGCAPGLTCASGADCASEVCSGMPLTCQAPVCGDGVANAAEVCDGGDLDGETCASQGFAGGGMLSCMGGCMGFNTANCNECDADGDCTMPMAPVCDEVGGTCEICVGVDDAACGTNETCDANNDCDCGPSPSSSTGPACTGTNATCDPVLGCICAAAGAACGPGEICAVGVGCVCGDTVGATGPACGGGAATCAAGVCDCNGGAAGGACGAKESCQGGQCDCGPTSGAAGAQACPDTTGNPECFPAVGCRCGDAGSTCGGGETCSLVVGGICTCGADSSPGGGEACPDTDEYRVCNAGVGCACAAGTCSNGFVCNVGAGECECDGDGDCPNGGTCTAGLCTCEGAVMACMIPGQTCNAADMCACGGGSCED